MKLVVKILSGAMLLLSMVSCFDKVALNRKYEELPLGSIRPEGWLREMLVRQRDGISADLDETYPQVMGERNGWLGGDGDQWERGPYWIDGLLPLAYVLDDDRLKEKVRPWVEWALASQKEDGSFGPMQDYPNELGLQRDNAMDWWPRMVVLKFLQQYFQQANQVAICKGKHNFDVSNGETSLLMGFLSGFPCCLSNLHQGWPKYTQNLWYLNDDGGLAALAYAPCSVCVELNGTQVKVVEDTRYPMDGKICFKISADTPVEFPLELRIPSWTTPEAVLCVNGEPVCDCVPGTVAKIERVWGTSDEVTLELPMTITTDRWYENAVSVERGPLVYALKIDEKWVEKKSHNPKYGDTYWEVYPQTPWNYALYQKDLDNVSESYEVVIDNNKLDSDWWWSLESVPVTIRARGARIEDWTLVGGHAGPLPYSKAFRKCTHETTSRKSEGKWEDIILVPYGATTLRVSEFPVLTR